MIMAVFVYSNSEIHEVTHRLQYRQVGPIKIKKNSK